MKFINWHRLLGITLTDFFTDTPWKVELEKDLSLKKQLLDVVIIERKEGEKKEGTMPEELPDGLENMAAHNLLSYKSFRESFNDWSADELLGHFVNYRKQIGPKRLIPRDHFRLYAVCTRFPEKLAKQTELINVKEGVYDFRWGSGNIRLIVTSRVPKEKKNAIWLMFSAIRDGVQYGISNYRGKLNDISSTIIQLVMKYETQGVIDMPYTIEDFRKETARLFPPEEILKNFSPEEILKNFSPEERLKGLPAAERLKGLPAEERLKGLPSEEILKELSFEEIDAYLNKLRKKQGIKKG